MSARPGSFLSKNACASTRQACGCERRSVSVRMVVSTVPVAAGRDHRPAGDLDSLEPTRFPRLLALEVPPRRRPSSDCRRDSGADPAYEPREPTVRRTADHAELLMLGIEVAESTVSRYMVRRHRPPSQVWKTFLRNHAAGIASLDLFVVRTISFKLLDGLMILRHGRRRLVAISVTTNPTAEWIAGQVTDAFPLGRSATSSAS